MPFFNIAQAMRAVLLASAAAATFLSEALRRRLLAWRHGGFSVHNEVSVAAEDTY